ncbi:MAG: hypothetical protein ACYCWE_07920 [Eubacteriales bacterium]
MDRNKLLTGAYFFGKNMYSDKHVKALADMGVDILVAVPPDKELLDLCEKYGIKVILSGAVPGWWGDNGQKAGQYKDSLDLTVFDKIKETYLSHPAIWGDYPVDEPNARDFAHIDAMMKKYRETFPGQLPFVNLYPNYASVLPSPDSDSMSQLGNITYKEHIEQYVRDVEDDYICFDSYPYGSVFSGYLENLDNVSEVCRSSGRDMWVIIQTGAWKPEAILDEYQIYWQTNLCLAYGTKIIMHACYYHGWWDNTTSCVDNDGNLNPTYYYAKNVNRDLHFLSDVFMRYKHLGVAVRGDMTRTEDRIRVQLEKQKNRSTFGGIEGVEIEADGAVAAGCFEKKDGNGYALMLVNTENPFNGSTEVSVCVKTCGCKKLTAYFKGVAISYNGSCSLNIKSGDGIFITIE